VPCRRPVQVSDQWRSFPKLRGTQSESAEPEAVRPFAPLASSPLRLSRSWTGPRVYARLRKRGAGALLRLRLPREQLTHD